MKLLQCSFFAALLAALAVMLTAVSVHAAICQGGECDEADEPTPAAQQAEQAAQPTAKPTRRAREMPWGRSTPQNCNRCINSVVPTCNQECKSVPKDKRLVCSQSCAQRYCEGYCGG